MSLIDPLLAVLRRACIDWSVKIAGVCICFCFRKPPRFAQGQYQSGQAEDSWLRIPLLLITSMGCGASKHAGFVEEAPAAVEEATPAVEEAPAAVEEDAPAVEEAPVYKATADVHPRDGVMLVKGKALLTLAEHKEYGKMTSHQILVVQQVIVGCIIGETSKI